MFSFIKWLGSLIESAKKKKGLWFTILSVLSLAGIFLSLYFVNFLVSDVAKKTYENQKTQFELRLKSQLFSHKERTLAVATTLTQNKELQNLFFSQDANSSNKIKKSASELEKRLAKTLDNKNFSVKFLRSEKFAEVKIINGLDVGDSGAYFVANLPFTKSENSVSNIVVKENIETLVKLFESEKREFVFMLNESSINKVSRSVKKDEYKKMFETNYIKEEAYNKSFVKSLQGINFETLNKDGYLKNKDYFYVVQSVFDIDGDEIGSVVIAESMSAENSFVNLVKNLVNSVTTVALGLIVSMILFLF